MFTRIRYGPRRFSVVVAAAFAIVAAASGGAALAQQDGSNRQAMPSAIGLLTITQTPDSEARPDAPDAADAAHRDARTARLHFDVSLEGYPLDRFVARGYRYFTDISNGDASDAAPGDASIGRILIAYHQGGQRPDGTNKRHGTNGKDGMTALILYDLRKRPAQVERIADGVEPSDVLWEHDALVLKAGGRWYKLVEGRLIRQTAWNFTFH